MKKAILVTGASGAGKSTLSRKLNELGYTAYDMDSYPGLLAGINKQTKQPARFHDNTDLEKVKLLEWVCDVQKLKSIIFNEQSDLAFYCGSAANIDDIIPLFEKTILLTIGPEVTRQRLTERTNNNFGKTREVQEWILSWQYEWDDKIGRKSSAIINAEQDLDTIARQIIEAAKS